MALKNNHNKVIKILMEKKAALDIPNSDGEIPFDYFTILIIILGIIIFNHFLFWKKGYDYKFSSYIKVFY